ncbi:hybrid sensor histidine kinase/response regulator [Aestuariirhabdus sp. Z084]|uniref:PAS domain-containing hybrid sensor histidine kinase/response regulator n=1 Tax=Aestuariirhabdus haliotis TaxID=2918751 RepID=UPI00201B4336|nr:hybrid sensor histidine kinase/response regulator [Aestuariirhabdus haliotis]MCL6417640.1 hybrid sensor histidine kinase/response regulator [Aestuariirhabdus haliotis]MCL6421566.1 hybrid sensor histidine kinase/response regulator [Aestuariirhabdus haliotis]
MLQGWLIAVISVVYISVLFVVAYYGDKKLGDDSRLRWLVYSLSLTVYCTSWTFFGAVGQAANSLWAFLPIYLGPILMFLFGWKLIARIIQISKQENITSIADFIAARYGKSQMLAVFITVIAVFGVLPYIALQLKAIMMGYNLLSAGSEDQLVSGFSLDFGQDTALLVTLILGAFTILFGTRHLDATEHHRGMMLAISFESIIKLVAILVVGVYITYVVNNGYADIWQKARAVEHTNELIEQGTNVWIMLAQTVLAALMILCLPRQFHVTVVENLEPSDLEKARWLFPLYLIGAVIFVVPIALAGQLVFSGSDVVADTFVMNLPLAMGQKEVALLAFIGGASAAISMVIVATVALSTMVSNDIVLPLFMRRNLFNKTSFDEFSGLLLYVRRTTIMVIVLMAYFYYRVLGSVDSLASTGLLSFAAVAQFAPAMIGGVLWKQANIKGVVAGLIAGVGLWFYTMVIPTLVRAGAVPQSFLDEGPWGIAGLSPDAIFRISVLDGTTNGIVISLVANLVCFLVVSWLTEPRLSEKMQAAVFVGAPVDGGDELSNIKVTLADLSALASRFVGERRVTNSFEHFAFRFQQNLAPNRYASRELLEHTERLLAGVIGASSARVVLRSAVSGRRMQLDDVVSIVDEASEALQFSRELLQGAIENISQGISVVDRDLHLVAWNRRYLEFFNYPDGLVRVGRPIADIIRYNASRGLCGEGDIEEHVAKRVDYMKQGTAHSFERVMPSGQVVEMQGNPMPGGGFVTSFTDITPYRKVTRELKQINEELEQRVARRTGELSQVNRQLVGAMADAADANQSKTRFLAAASHDLMQPLNAARLFTASLVQQEQPGEGKELAQNIDSSLRAAEELLTDLLDISKLDAGGVEPQFSDFPVSELLSPLCAEFSAMAESSQMEFDTVNSSQVIRSDNKLLRRIVQNFLTNAFRYAKRGRVVLGCRRQGDKLRIEIWDNGPGIPQSRLQEIFEEFRRLDSHATQEVKGVGLGLAIAERISKMLDHPLAVRSWEGAGSVFSVEVPLGDATQVQQRNLQKVSPGNALRGRRVLCIDNEETILAGMKALLERWQCEVFVSRDLAGGLALLDSGIELDILLADYHLDDGKTGLEAILGLRQQMGVPLPAVLITADGRQTLQDQAREEGVAYLAKPVKPAALRALISSLSRR